jgi:hypothetical protein
LAITLLPQEKQIQAIYLRKGALETNKKIKEELIGYKYIHKWASIYAPSPH